MMKYCQFLETLVDKKQKNTKNNSKVFQKQRLTNNCQMQSQNSWLFGRNIKFERWYIRPFP